ncbi:MAG TPA: hypothetical protein VIJ22_07250 [Polyangiaceae bacterium]
MQTFVRTSLFSILATAAVACSAHGQVAVQAPPPPEATVVVGTAPPPPPPPATVVVQPPPPPPPPPPPAVHPAYLHALTDLRNARFNLTRRGGDRNMKWDEAVAIGAIDRAIADIKAAAIDDGKNIDDHPPVDAREPRAGRLHKALAALRQTLADVNQEEDNAYAQGLKAKAIRNVNEAIRLTEQGIFAAEHDI